MGGKNVNWCQQRKITYSCKWTGVKTEGGVGNKNVPLCQQVYVEQATQRGGRTICLMDYNQRPMVLHFKITFRFGFSLSSQSLIDSFKSCPTFSSILFYSEILHCRTKMSCSFMLMLSFSILLSRWSFWINSPWKVDRRIQNAESFPFYQVNIIPERSLAYRQVKSQTAEIHRSLSFAASWNPFAAIFCFHMGNAVKL